ncbi:restriction endonuclease [Paraburkholderia sp. BL23I1N1]|uniref:restriction endonuclease n=1 Tax=Paraburkholderia sp. BL23I1N1 TaxID=1938802 RepID=UPI000FF1E20C|nr:restriction endonuclease [Paraburkholderia sp. BL23I1N1]RKE37217.1 restriction endonuclease [Paraburkholderia sp. BL23I1N1]
MAALDFTEIASPTTGKDRDQFELFAREFLTMKGFAILTDPDRGPDAGRDLVIEETRTGIAGETKVRWLVSCKHNANSGVSVLQSVENDIRDRIETHDCAGFVGFYSTVPSSGLATKLRALEKTYPTIVFDREKIEAALLASREGLLLARRFMPVSSSLWEKDHPKAAKIFSDEPSLQCKACGKELLGEHPAGIVVGWRTYSESYDPSFKPKHEYVYWCCKGRCDDRLEAQYRKPGLIDGWEDIPDLVIPIVYIRWVMSTLNELQGSEQYSKEAFEATKELLLNLFPMVAREPSAQNHERIQSLSAIPSFLGGWGYDGGN